MSYFIRIFQATKSRLSTIRTGKCVLIPARYAPEKIRHRD